MDLEEIGTSAFDVEFLQMLNQETYKKGFDKGYDAGFTAAICTIVSVGKKRKRRGCAEVCRRLCQWTTSRQRREGKMRGTRRDELGRSGLNEPR